MKRLSLKQIGTAYLAGTVITSITGYAIADVLWSWGYRPSYWHTIEFIWLAVVGLPSMVVVSNTLLQVLGKKTPIQITTNSAIGQGRKVAVNYSNRKSHVFLSALPMLNRGQPEPEPVEIPQSITITMDGNEYKVPITEIRDFLYVAWSRQRAGKHPFSRNWWTVDKRPKMRLKKYNALMLVLNQGSNSVINRGQGRSGELLLPPESTIKRLQGLI